MTWLLVGIISFALGFTWPVLFALSVASFVVLAMRAEINTH